MTASVSHMALAFALVVELLRSYWRFFDVVTSRVFVGIICPVQVVATGAVVVDTAVVLV